MKTIEFTFLLCSERSGSNLITTRMGGHPKICAPPPSHLFRLFGGNAANYGDLTRDDNWEILLADVIAAFENQLGVWNTHPTIEYLRSHATVRTVAEPLRLIYEQEAQYTGATQVFVKENHTARFADFLLDHFDPCRFVFMARDPRDVAASYLTTDGIPGGVEKAVEVWKRDQEDNLALYSRLLASGNILFLKYEDLTAQANQELSRIATFLGLDYDPAMLRAHEQELVQKNATKIDAWQNLAKPVLAQNSGKFVQTLTEAEIEYVELACQESMRALGYPLHIVQSVSAEAGRLERMEALRPLLREGHYRLADEHEQETRRNRLAIINTVLSRRLT